MKQKCLSLLLFLFSSLAATENITERDYWAPVTTEENQMISTIVNTLGNASLFDVLKATSSLREAGKKIHHVHPLKFLLVILSNPTTSKSLQRMQSRSWIWEEFIGDVRKNLQHESSQDNLTVAMVSDFSTHLGLNQNLIHPLVNEKEWDKFVNTIIQQKN